MTWRDVDVNGTWCWRDWILLLALTHIFHRLDQLRRPVVSDTWQGRGDALPLFRLIMCELDYNVREKSVDIQFQLDASVFDSSEIDMFIFCKVVEGVGGWYTWIIIWHNITPTHEYPHPVCFFGSCCGGRLSPRRLMFNHNNMSSIRIEVYIPTHIFTHMLSYYYVYVPPYLFRFQYYVHFTIQQHFQIENVNAIIDSVSLRI